MRCVVEMWKVAAFLWFQKPNFPEKQKQVISMGGWRFGRGSERVTGVHAAACVVEGDEHAVGPDTDHLQSVSVSEWLGPLETVLLSMTAKLPVGGRTASMLAKPIIHHAT